MIPRSMFERFGSFADVTGKHHVARKLRASFEPQALAADLAAVPATDWMPYVGRYYDAGRYLSVNVGPTSLFREVVNAWPATVRMARLTRLLPGGSIHRHRDNNVPRDSVRIHVPITTSGNVEFTIGGVTLPMQAGEAWQIDPRFPHEVHNRGDSDRVHLIVDLTASEQLLRLLDEGRSVRQAPLWGYFGREVLRLAIRR